jgi:hypothetical protein
MRKLDSEQEQKDKRMPREKNKTRRRPSRSMIEKE